MTAAGPHVPAEQRENLRRLAGEATPGEWEHKPGSPTQGVPPHVRATWRDEQGRRCQRFVSGVGSGDIKPADREWMSAANPVVVFGLLDDLEAAEAAREKADDAAQQMMFTCSDAVYRAEQVEAEVARLRAVVAGVEALAEHGCVEVIEIGGLRRGDLIPQGDLLAVFRADRGQASGEADQ